LRQPQNGQEEVPSQYRILPNQQLRLPIFRVSIVAESRKLSAAFGFTGNQEAPERHCDADSHRCRFSSMSMELGRIGHSMGFKAQPGFGCGGIQCRPDSNQVTMSTDLHRLSGLGIWAGKLTEYLFIVSSLAFSRENLLLNIRQSVCEAKHLALMTVWDPSC
jgi:hypothetical protein